MSIPRNILFEKHPEYTRKKKKNLLIGSFISWAMAFANIIPEKISVVGIQFSHIDTKSFLIILGILITYYLFDFYSSVWIDIERSKGKIQTEYEVSYESKEDEIKNDQKINSPEYIKKQKYIETKYTQPWQYALPSVLFRMILDSIIPLVLYIIAIIFICIKFFNVI